MSLHTYHFLAFAQNLISYFIGLKSAISKVYQHCLGLLGLWSLSVFGVVVVIPFSQFLLLSRYFQPSFAQFLRFSNIFYISFFFSEKEGKEGSFFF